jgi:hypothetical protein
MRAVVVVSDVLPEGDGPLVMGQLAGAGLRPCVLALEPGAAALPAGLDVPVVTSPVGRPECWDESRGLLAAAVARCGAAASETFVFGSHAEDISAAADGGCRPVLVLGARTLDDVFGPEEPHGKSASAAPDLQTAARYAMEEAAQEAVIGPFPYAESVSVEARPRPLGPSPRDLAALLALVTVAGVAIALGIAYLLQEVYQRATLPAAAYWVTLQFIPQALRGLLFLALGGTVGLMVRPYLSRLSGRYRARRV